MRFNDEFMNFSSVWAARGAAEVTSLQRCGSAQEFDSRGRHAHAVADAQTRAPASAGPSRSCRHHSARRSARRASGPSGRARCRRIRRRSAPTTVATVLPVPPPIRLPRPPPISAPPIAPTAFGTFCTESCWIDSTVPTRADGLLAHLDTPAACCSRPACSEATAAASAARGALQAVDVPTLQLSPVDGRRDHSGIAFSRYMAASNPDGRPRPPSHCAKIVSMSPDR